MGRKGNWLSSVKKALSPEPKEKKDQRADKSKKKWFGKHKYPDPNPSSLETVPGPSLAPPEEVKTIEPDNEHHKHVYSVAATTTMASLDVPETDVEVVEITTLTQSTGKAKEEAAAIKIQTAFRGYLARRALRALRGLVRLQSLIQGTAVKRQAANTLRCMQTLARVQSQICYRRSRMSEENQALQRQLLQKQAKEFEQLKMGEEWDDSLQSKEQIEAGLLNKQGAAMRRERALAYAFSHQQAWKNSSKSTNLLFMDPSNPHWGWSWLERWMAARPWEGRSTTDKELNNDQSSIKSGSRSITGGEITKAYARHLLDSSKPSPTASQKPYHPPARQSPSTPPSKAVSSSSAAGKFKPAASPRGNLWGQDDDTKSMASMQSERFRRHSIAGSSVGDDESLASSPAVPSYMAPTKSAKAKSRLQSPLGLENNGTPEKGSSGIAKKRLSFPASPARPRRHSGPPRVESSTLTESIVSNGGGTVS